MNSVVRNTFSANSLQDYSDCQRRYELKYLLNQSWPAVPSEPVLEIEENIKKGNRFHFLVHQFFLGVPIKTLLKSIEDENISSWFNHFLSFQASINAKQVFSEFSLTAKIGENALFSVYDMIFLDKNGNLGIIDWKTSHYLPTKATLGKRIQTILYPYILYNSAPELLKIDDFPAEKIFMRYWYPAYPHKVFIFPYNQELHAASHKFLQDLIEEIKLKNSGDFKFTNNTHKCKYCPYRSLCDRGNVAANLGENESINLDESDLDFDFDQLPEITPNI
ncbi:MAG: PD-(D/E)XK nuclease family protein [Anaerolineaceae bacterium]|nr:PD-(D/E)XK nuclease family protein [Anaerolineaceae bacterium]